MSQAPQWLALANVSVQVPVDAHHFCPVVGHLHTPLTQLSPELQTFPQEPQLSGSLDNVLHWLVATQKP